MELLVTQYFVFRRSDLREWEEEPEEWEKREEEITDAWEFSIRSCSEKLFLDLVINFKDLLVPKLLHVFYNYASKFFDRGIVSSHLLTLLKRSAKYQYFNERFSILSHWSRCSMLGETSRF